MKKVLLGTSAIALASAFATSAHSAEWEVKVGGYMEQHVAFASSDGDNLGDPGDVDGVDSKQDSEIFFKPSITLDNGIKIGADIQLEGFQNGDQIDESFMFIRGSFGEVLLGSENSAGYKMSIVAPDVTYVNASSNSLASFIPYSGGSQGANLFRATLGSTFIENLANNDAQRITYFTPRFAGLQLGLSYARDGNQDSNTQINCAGAACNFFDVGVNYVNSFGGFDVAVSGQYGIADTDGAVAGDQNNAQVWSAGASFGFAGVTIGGSFNEQNNGGNLDGISYDAGVSYETGPWGFSFTYLHGENEDNENFNTGLAGGNTEEELDIFLVGARYNVAKGVGVGLFGAYVVFEEEFGDPNSCGAVVCNNGGDDVDGFVIGSSLKISF